MKKKFLLLLVLLAFCFVLLSCKGEPGAAGPAGATGPLGPTNPDGLIVINLQNSPTYNGTTDTFIVNQDSLSNYGSDPFLVVGNNNSPVVINSLVRFDLSTIIPNDITISKAYLTLFVSGLPYSGISFPEMTVTPYAVNSQWIENYATWESPDDGYTEWNGGNYTIAAGNSIKITSSNYEQFVTFELNPSVVQSWIALPSSNNGIILNSTFIVDDAAILFSSSENYDYDFNTAPKLTLYYSLND